MGRLQKIGSLWRWGSTPNRQNVSKQIEEATAEELDDSETSSVKEDLEPKPNKAAKQEQSSKKDTPAKREIPLSIEEQEEEIQRMGTCYFHARILLPSTVDVGSGFLDVDGDTNRRLCVSRLDQIIHQEGGLKVEGVQLTQDSTYWQRCAMCIAASRYGSQAWDEERTMQLSGTLQISSNSAKDERPEFDLAWLKLKHSRLYSETYKLSAPHESPIITSQESNDPWVAIQRARTMAKECIANHPRCPGGQLAELPSRVLELDTHDKDMIRVCITNKSFGQYAALSYCWGTGRQTKLTSNTVATMQGYFPVTRLPQVIQDAVHITRQLGLRYLWVDSLCIVQDDARDKAREIASMDRIFSCAYITIAAAATPSCDEGFIELYTESTNKRPKLEILRSFKSTPMGKLYLPCIQQNSIATVDFKIVSDELSYTQPLSRRAWTLQEMLLSPRVLVFSSEQITWRCTSQTRMLADGAVRYIMRSGADHIESLENESNLYDCWSMLVKEYCSRVMTYETDRLMGFDGIAAQFKRALSSNNYDDTYLAGLWKGQLPAALGWYTLRPQGHCEAEGPGYPSWSWASAAPFKELIYPSSSQDTNCSTTFMHCSLRQLDESALASTMTVGIITLKGDLYRLHWDGAPDIRLGPRVEAVVHPDHIPTYESFRENLPFYSNTFLLPVSKRFALMLRRSKAGNGRWVRVGVAEAIVGFWSDIEDGWVTGVIEIE